MQTTKLKEAEAKARALRTELVMLNSQLPIMREEKEQYKQELQKTLERPQHRKHSRKRRKRAY